MILTALLSHINTMIYDGFEENEEYQEIKTAYNAAEKELVLSMTKKQRRMFHECMRQREDLTRVELHQLLSHYTVLIPVKNRSVSCETNVPL